MFHLKIHVFQALFRSQNQLACKQTAQQVSQVNRTDQEIETRVGVCHVIQSADTGV